MDIFKNNQDRHYIIEYNSKIIGHVAIIHKNTHLFEIQIVIGEKKYWGKGLGVKAIKRAVNIAFTKLSYNKACLEVRPDNMRAIKAYQAVGFIKKGLKKYPQNKHLPVTLKMSLNKKNFAGDTRSKNH